MTTEDARLRGPRDYDARIVDLYDGDNPDGADHDYYRLLADRTGARTILDVGCGTGILTVTFARPDRTVVGVDPSTSMIAYARQRPGGNRVTWIEGDTRGVAADGFDLMVMTGNVAQHIPDPQWQRTLRDLHHVAKSGSLLAFESRNPAARAWTGWSQPDPTTRQTSHGPLREWSEVAELGDGQVLLRFFNHFGRSDELVIQEELLTFRDHATLTAQLADAGFEVSAVWGDWKKSPFDGAQPIMVFEARAV